MYGKKQPEKHKNTSVSDKNPNRVTGGLRAQGVDKFVMMAEDGSQQEIPTVEYVRSLEEQSRKQRAAINVLERKLTRCETAIEQLKNAIIRFC
jgi:hypothetical protein